MQRLPSTPCDELLNRLLAHGFDSYLVGGCVRDLWLRRTPHDFDITTQALPADIKRVFADVPVIETGLKYGTVTVLWQGVPYEITTFRVDGVYTDGRRPDAVRFTADITDDLARRDFTINAMAARPPDVWLDPFGGAHDCDARLIRCVGEPSQRFDEDALRILRALRFAATLGFAIEAQTQAAITTHAPKLQAIARERITQEIRKLLHGAYPCTALQNQQAVFAQLSNTWRDMTAAAWQLLCDSLQATENPMARLALLCGNSLPNCLKLDNAAKARVAALLRHRNRSLPTTVSEATRLLADLGAQKTQDWLDYQAAQGHSITAAQALRDSVLAHDACYSLSQLAVNGADLLALGYPPDCSIGTALHDLLDGVIEGLYANERESLLNAARKWL